MAKQTVNEALAGIMELQRKEDREQVALWALKLARSGVWLEAGSVRRMDEAALREFMGGKA